MKKILSTLCMALVAVAMMGQEPVITFDKTEHDFGKIHEEDGRVSVEFTFTNEGMSPLVLSNVRASCGCTTPKWTKDPVEPGQTGVITVTYNPNGRPGRFQKTVTVTSNAKEATTRVYIKGEVIPKQAKPVNKYTVAVGELNMKSMTLDLGTIKKGESKKGELEYTNLKEEDHKVELATSSANSQYFFSQATLPTAKKNEVGKFAFELNTANAKLYGPVELYAYVVVDGKEQITDDYKLTVMANIVEDFSALTTEQKQQAPIIEAPAELNAGVIAKGKTHKFVFPIKNTGMNPLEIRRIYSPDKALSIKMPKAIKNGKKGMVTIEIHTKDMMPGEHISDVVIISNDYLHPIKKAKLHFTIE